MKSHQIKPTSCFSAWYQPLITQALCLTAICVASTICQAQTPVFTNLWNLSSGTNASAGLPNDLPASGNNVRGIAINPVNTNVVYASTAAGTNGGNNHVTVLDYTNGGAYLVQLNATGVPSGIGAGGPNMAPVRVADDGRIYACNVSLATGQFAVYKWDSDSDVTTPINLIYGPAVTSVRYGDNMDVRGAGIDTEIVVTGNGGAGLFFLKPADATLTTWTNVQMTFPGGVSMGARGVAFDGTNNAIYGKPSGSAQVNRIAYDLGTATNYVTSTFQLDQTATAGIDFAEINGVKLLSAIVYGTTAITNGAAHRARVYQLISASNQVSVLNQYLPFPNQANANGIAMTDIRNGHFVFSEPNNGISLYKISEFITNTPPALGGAPTGGGVYVAGYSPITLAVTASGSTPLSYQWYFNTNTAIPGATTNSLSLGVADDLDVGNYRIIVTNSYGSVTSSFATISVQPAGYSTVATQVWTLAPGSRPYLTTTDHQRGLAYDAISQRLVLVSRGPITNVYLLDAATGADLGEMDQTFSTTGSGTFPINMVSVADDGIVYACNLTSASDTSAFFIYSWPGASNTLEGVVQGSAFANTLPVGGRLGDTFAARGAGVNTELLAAFNAGTNIALFTTTDGISFNFNLIVVTNLPADAQANGFARLGITFGPTNTFWAKSSGFNLRLVRYDVAAGTGEVIASFTTPPGSVAPIGVDNANHLLAGIATGQIPQNLALYDLTTSGGPALIDRELFPANNSNLNGTGAVAFDVAGGRLFSLDSNNGILALNYAPRLYIAPDVAGGVVTWSGPGALQASANVTGTYTNVTGATSPYTNTAASSLFFRVRR